MWKGIRNPLSMWYLFAAALFLCTWVNRPCPHGERKGTGKTQSWMSTEGRCVGPLSGAEPHLGAAGTSQSHLCGEQQAGAAPVIPGAGLCHINVLQPPRELADNVIKQ